MCGLICETIFKLRNTTQFSVEHRLKHFYRLLEQLSNTLKNLIRMFKIPSEIIHDKKVLVGKNVCFLLNLAAC